MTNAEFPDNQRKLPEPQSAEGVADEAQQEPDSFEVLVANVNPTELDDNGLEDLVDQHPLVQTMQQRLAERRRSRMTTEEEREAVDEMRLTRQAVGDEVKRRLGMLKEDEEPEDVRAERERLERLAEIQSSLTGTESDDQLLAKFGLTDEMGKVTRTSMRSPLLRTDTGKAFRQYLDSVLQHLAMERAEEMAGTRVKGSLEASNLRGEAHDAVSAMVAEDLGLPFEDARRFVAKARDGIIPGSGERNNYANLVRGRRLAEEFHGDVAAFTRSALGDIIRRRKGGEGQ